jgi:hypothetical protein
MDRHFKKSMVFSKEDISYVSGVSCSIIYGEESSFGANVEYLVSGFFAVTEAELGALANRCSIA